MKNEAIKIFQKKKSVIIEKWIKEQLQDDGLREDMISNEDLRIQSEELLNSVISTLSDSNIENPASGDFDSVTEILSSISISRAKQGLTMRG